MVNSNFHFCTWVKIIDLASIEWKTDRTQFNQLEKCKCTPGPCQTISVATHWKSLHQIKSQSRNISLQSSMWQNSPKILHNSTEGSSTTDVLEWQKLQQKQKINSRRGKESAAIATACQTHLSTRSLRLRLQNQKQNSQSVRQ